MAAGAGIILGAFVFFISGLLRAPLLNALPQVIEFAATIDRYVPIPYACRLILTIFASIAAANALNAILWVFYGRGGRGTEKRIYDKVVGRFGNSMSQLFRKAAARQKLVLLTLKSRKIYCGRILEVPNNINDDDAYVEILPSFSTWRDKDSLRMGGEKTEYPVIALWEAKQYLYSRQGVLRIFDHMVESFGDVAANAITLERERLQREINEAQAVIDKFGDYDIAEVNDWIKVIPVREIESASFYDPDAYRAWFQIIVDASPTK
ncbi:hypothetical protein [Pseudoxanthomonas sp. 10H]|uniref:hypothetical protein n=1 Tax=Pseudoxanthomonas sp. 10H TaxID=3242729 RepID=UPI003555E362